MSNVKLLFKRCNQFCKLSNILPPPLEEGVDFLPEIPKNPVPKAFQQETVETMRPEKTKKHHVPEAHLLETFRPKSKATAYDDDEPKTVPAPADLVLDDPFDAGSYGPTVLAPEYLQTDVAIPKAPLMPRDMALTEIPPSSKRIAIVLDEDGHFARENNQHLFEDGKLKFDKSDIMSAIRQAKRDFVG